MSYINCHICLELGRERAAEAGSLICGPCLLRTYFILREIGDLYEWISDASYLAGTREPSSHYTKSRPPVSLHAVSLLDQRSKYRRKGDPVSAERVLRAWWFAVQESQGWDTPSGPKEVHQLASVLQGKLPWISQQPAVARFARHMAFVLHSLKQEVGTKNDEEEGDEDND